MAAGVGDIKHTAQAFWLKRDTLAWPINTDENTLFQLHFDPQGALHLTPQGLTGGQTYTLEFAGRELSPALAEEFPYLKTALMLRLPDAALDQVAELLKGQIALSASSPNGALLAATGLQTAGVLDDLYANQEALGIQLLDGLPVLHLWAPTARSVMLLLYPSSDPSARAARVPMDYDSQTGVWQAHGEADWMGLYYQYEVQVYVRQEGRLVTNIVTDPYALSLSMNSTRAQIVDLEDQSLKPSGWDSLVKPTLDAPEDIVIYELHIRDFSIFDTSLPMQARGTYLAFTHPDSHGMKHLKRLADAGLTHVHLLPSFDIATINENKAEWKIPDYLALAALPPDSDRQQAILQQFRGRDGYNWGYDPFHYTTPEGSYSTQPDGPTRIREFRAMVKALNQAGLRVVLDVVYNHTHAAGQSEKSVLDRIVPGYYHRLDANGDVTTSSCCPNTASEHAMMEKLMIDSVMTWARAYKIDGFRFDLMGHHLAANMQHVRQALDSLSAAEDGIDGRSIYIYGEGWNFGEVAGGARGENATQFNLAGTGIGTFNDRIRDAVRGGGPFSSLQEQGFINGLYTDPNSSTHLPADIQRSKLLEISDWIRVCLAGNLAEYELVNANGVKVTGAAVGYNGLPAGYTRDPQENIVYISAHDNETLFDALQYKAPLETSLEQRVRMQNLGISLVSLSQGIPFFHAGCELLRSKSMDRDSYDSGDWFNRLDYTYQTNNWGVGLPPADKNLVNYYLMQPLLGNPSLKPSPEHILAARSHFEEMLRIRKSSPLFRLQTAAEIKQRVLFYNTGPGQIPGLIVMAITDQADHSLDPDHELVVVLFNAKKEAVEYPLEALQAPDLALHPILANSADQIVRTARFEAGSKTFIIPGRTTAVFWGQGHLAETPAPA
ncbi:MAG: pullulanase-type alpha-1,6-glucosidase, partial [Anaerolineales bacterium]